MRSWTKYFSFKYCRYVGRRIPCEAKPDLAVCDNRIYNNWLVPRFKISGVSGAYVSHDLQKSGFRSLVCIL